MGEPRYSIRDFLKFLLSERRQNGESRKDEPPKDEPLKVESPKFQELLIVVAALIAAVTFQACVNPPGGVWQETKGKREAGRAVYSEDETAFYTFLAFNTLAFSTSMYILICLTLAHPFFFEVVVAMVSMGTTYGASIFAITPKGFKGGDWLLTIAAAPVILRAIAWAAKLIYQ